jgi:Fic family protein
MTYKVTHPWINFEIDLKDLAIKTWIQLGECASKCDQISGVPLKPVIRDYLQLIYLAKGIKATTAIEGNTLTEEEVKKIIEHKADIPPSKEYLEQEIKNILKACNMVADHLRNNIEVVVSPEKIREYNSIVLENLPHPDDIEAGEFRKHRVTVGRYLGPNPEQVPFLVEKLCDWLNSDSFKPDKNVNPIIYAIIKAIIAHIYIAWIHPFGDGNGRTARLIEFKILAQSGVPSPAIHLLSNHYNNTRTEYYNQLEKTSKLGGKINDFISYAVQGFLDGFNEQLPLIRAQQIEVAMENYIHERFIDLPGKTWTRRRHLALDILASDKPIRKEEILLLSKRLNDAYKDKNPRTISRDLAVLLDMGLIRITNEGFRIDFEPILAFLPLRKST